MEGRSICHRLKFLEQIIWMNFSVDILYLQIQPWTPGFEEKLLKLVKAHQLEGLRYLALWMNTWDALYYTGFRSELLEALPNLYELILVDNDDGMSLATDGTMRWKRGSEMTFVELSAEKEECMLRPNGEGIDRKG
jgi:hypothetical protein